MKAPIKIIALCLAFAATPRANAQTNEMTVNAAKPGAAIQKTMYGIFFEDINFAADGGLYAEMVKNRSFEFKQPLMGWTAFGSVTVNDDGPFERCPHYARLADPGHKHRRTGLENEGFFGIAVEKDSTYRFSLWARCPDGGTGALRVELVDNHTMREWQQFTADAITVAGKDWRKYTLTIKSPLTMADARLRLILSHEKGEAFEATLTTIDVEHVSLFPTATWRGRENGMRHDLAKALFDLHPGIFRFPGGCIVEGTRQATRYQWKNTVGPVENRPTNENRWEDCFDYRLFPDYYQSGGLGFYEFFQLCEDFGCEALPVLSCGLACQFQNETGGKPDTDAHVPVDKLNPYIQDALDLIEFANGSTETKWGKVRADMGHPAPFGLHYMGIGNEQWDYKDNPVYTERLLGFLDVLRKQHPEIKYIGSTGPFPDGLWFDTLQPKMKELKADLYDEHYYKDEQWFLDAKNRHRYDTYDRKGPRVFAGEYACHGTGKKWNHWGASLLEAAFMTGFERNADIVSMATYAPLFAHVKGWQWRPDMIWYDNQRSVKTCSYYVQQLYSRYKGTQVLPLTMVGKVVAGDDDQHGLFASSVLDKATSEIYVKIANVSDTPQPVRLTFKGVKRLASARLITLHADTPTAENSLDNPTAIIPQEQPAAVNGNTLAADIPAKTFCVLLISKH